MNINIENVAVISSDSIKSKAMLDILISKNPLLQKIEFIERKELLQLIIVIGGDGTLLRSIKSYMHLNIPFYGINTGTVGFLMNDVDKNSNLSEFDALQKIKNCNEVKLIPLDVTIKDIDGNVNLEKAINEASIYRAGIHSTKFNIYINEKKQLSNIIADGMMVATPAGSSAYNSSAGGSILPLSSNAICLTPICPFRPRNLTSVILPSDSIVKFEIADFERRPVNASIDFIQINNVSEMIVKNSKDSEIKLLLDYNFENKAITEQFRLYEQISE